MTKYPEAVKGLIRSCQEYREGQISIEDLQSRIWRANGVILDVTERDLYKLLISIEGDLELARFTVDSDRVYSTSMPIVERLESALRKSLA